MWIQKWHAHFIKCIFYVISPTLTIRRVGFVVSRCVSEPPKVKMGTQKLDTQLVRAHEC